MTASEPHAEKQQTGCQLSKHAHFWYGCLLTT